MRRVGALIALMSLVAIAAIGLNAESSMGRAESRQANEAPKPGPEMQKLNFLIGEWDMQAEYLKTPMTGDGGKATGWYKAQLGPGRFSVIADFEENGPLGFLHHACDETGGVPCWPRRPLAAFAVPQAL